MKSILKHVLLTAKRDWLYVGLIVLLGLATGTSALLGGTAALEKVHMTIVSVAGSSRVISVMGLVLFVCFYIKRSFENKEVQFILAKPISRSAYFLSLWFGFVVIAASIVVVLGLLLNFFTVARPYYILVWCISLLNEMMIVITFASLATLILQSAVISIMASLGFYFISRMMGFFVLTVSMPDSLKEVSNWSNAVEFLLKIISTVFPRLDLFAQTDWLIYGYENAVSGLTMSLIQTAIFVPFMLAIAFYDFGKKQF